MHKRNFTFLKTCILLFLVTLLPLLALHSQTTINRAITLSTDDAEEQLSNGGIDRSSDDLEFAYDEGYSRFQKVGMRFTALNIPQGAVITNAYIRFQARFNGSGAVTIQLNAQAADNPTTFTSGAYNISDRPLTTSTVNWSPANWASSSYYNTVNISSLVQEVVNRPGWTSGNAMVFVAQRTTTTQNTRAAYSFDGNGAAPTLYITYTLCSPAVANPIFTLGTTSTRCQGSGPRTYTATAANATGITYSLNAAALSAGNTINASNGTVNYVANWTGTTIITASAQGCQGAKTATHTVTTTPNVGTPVFSGSPATVRCLATATVTYTATALNNTGIAYSISNTGTGTLPTINSTTGQVSYASNWVGSSTITATASGCGTQTTASITVSSIAVRAIADAATGTIGQPVTLNLTTNDLCGYNNASLSIITQPTNGTVQVGTAGNVTYLPNGNFTGTDQFVYQICTGSTAGSGTCSQATATITITDDGSNICATVNNPHTYYLPFPENTLLTKKALQSASSSNAHTTTTRSLVSIRTNYPNTIIYYDHWEDGYEATPGTKTQTSTLIWGDGNLSNGVAPGFANDILPEGAVITLDNTFTDRSGDGRTLSNANRYYDGRDKIYSGKALNVVKVTGDGGLSGTNALFDIQNFKTNVTDVSRFGNLFVLPFGENINNLYNNTNPTSIYTTVFNYVGVFVRASKNNTVAKLDYNGDGLVDIESPVLQEGQVWFYDGTETAPGTPPASSDQTGANHPPNKNRPNDIKSGAIITANNPVGVDLVFGDLFNFGTRNIPVLPGKYYGSTYYSPVHTAPHAVGDAVDGVPTYAVFTNSLNEPITINWNSGAGSSGSFVLPAKGYNSLKLSNTAGYKFQSTNGKSFTAVTIIDVAESSVTNGSGSHAGGFDWAFSMIPDHQLSNMVGTAWAPGRNGSADPSQNYHPVWITAPNATTVYVKYNGRITDVAGLTSPCGLKYDVAHSINALQSLKIFNPSGNQTGMTIYTCDGTKIAGVWGQHATNAPAGSPAMDVGYVLDPLCMNQIIVANDDVDRTFPNVPVTIPILNNDVGELNPGSVVITTPPANGTVQVHPDGTVTYTPNTNYTGTDEFYYQVCNTSTPALCDIAKVTITIDCATVTGKNYISGKIFDDANANGTLNTNELGIEHSVNLYNDANGNGLVDAGEALLQTVQTTNNGAYTIEINATSVTRRYVVRPALPLPVGKFITTPQPAGLYAVTFTGAGSQCNKDFGIANEVTISGNVFNDINGLKDAIVNGSAYTAPIYVTLVDAVTGRVLANKLANNTTGGYTFSNADGVLPNSNYILYLNEGPVAINSIVGTTPVADLPADWVSTGEHIGPGIGNDGLPANSRINVTTAMTPVENVNFGIQQPPYAGEGRSSDINPGGTIQVPVPPTAFSSTEPSSDPSPGTVTAIRLTGFPTGATTIVINSITYNSTVTADVLALTALIIPTNEDGEPQWAITADPTANGNTEVVFNFKAIDNAGMESANTGIAILSLTTPGISGTVFEDNDGPANIDGIPTNGNGLYVNVLDQNNIVVFVAEVGINCDNVESAGEFCIPAGMLGLGNYTLQLSNTPGEPGETAPAKNLNTGWFTVGESLGSTGNDLLHNGLLDVQLGSVNVEGVRFGIKQSTLPVTFLSFIAQKNYSQVVLKWSTANEKNNQGFNIERSSDGRNWSKIGSVNSKAINGNSNTDLSYVYNDLQPLAGQNYYRLKQIDLNGIVDYSAIRSVKFDVATKVILTPNPTNSNITIAGLSGYENIALFDITGKKINQIRNTNNAQITIAVHNLSEGTYMVQIIGKGGKIVTEKFIKTR